LQEDWRFQSKLFSFKKWGTLTVDFISFHLKIIFCSEIFFNKNIQKLKILFLIFDFELRVNGCFSLSILKHLVRYPFFWRSKKGNRNNKKYFLKFFPEEKRFLRKIHHWFGCYHALETSSNFAHLNLMSIFTSVI